MSRRIHYIQTKFLDLAFEQEGRPSDPPVILLHGWPDDVRTWDRIVPRLTAAGFRTIAPYLRGFGPTRFRADSNLRSGQLAALGADVIEMAQALGLERFALVGHDWGARAAYIAAAEIPSRVSHVVALSVGYGTNHPDQVLPIHQARNYWYHWYFCLPRGAELVRQSGRELARFMWQTWSPTWTFSDAEYDQTARSFENPDWAGITIHSYRHRWGQAEGDPHYDALERRLARPAKLAVPTLVLHGAADGANDPVTSAGKEQYFSNRYKREVLPNVGHFPQREDPERVADEIVAWLKA